MYGGELFQKIILYWYKHEVQVQEFGIKVTGLHRNDAMIRKIKEAVKMDRTDTNIIMNDRVE